MAYKEPTCITHSVTSVDQKSEGDTEVLTMGSTLCSGLRGNQMGWSTCAERVPELGAGWVPTPYSRRSDYGTRVPYGEQGIVKAQVQKSCVRTTFVPSALKTRGIKVQAPARAL